MSNSNGRVKRRLRLTREAAEGRYQRAVKMLQSGAPVWHIKEQLKVSQSTLSAYRRRAVAEGHLPESDLKIRSAMGNKAARQKRERYTASVRMFKSGKKMSEVADEFGVKESTAATYMREALANGDLLPEEAPPVEPVPTKPTFTVIQCMRFDCAESHYMYGGCRDHWLEFAPPHEVSWML